MAFVRIVAAFLVACVAGARCQSIDCNETGNTIRCEYQQECHVHCKSSCLEDSHARVFGTVYYSLESSICKSALHDLRISSWNSSIWTVSLKLTKEQRSDFAESMRYGVTSESSFYSKGYFEFTSPRIKEEVLDVTALHRDFIYNNFTVSRLECHGPKDRTITFGYSITEVRLKNVNLHPQPINGTYVLALNKGSYPHARTNVFWCKIQGSTLSNVGSPAMFYEAKGGPTFLPQNYTVTASLNEPLTLRVQSVHGESAPPVVTSWARVNVVGNATKLTNTGSDSKWSIPRVGLSHSAVYVANGPNTLSPGRNRGVFRVIVRTCKDGFHGQSCNYYCPKCKNGGVCHDITGDCICPPGFRGQTCESQCGDDYFGRVCQHRCSDTNKDRNVRSCRGILMCLPDPYGCSCGTGFRGPFCNETCPPHTYGADCKQSRICFCKNEQFCDIYTGVCRRDGGECLQGWKNRPYCDISYPLLKRSPSVRRISDQEATIEFNAWTKNMDDGEGEPKEYRIEFKVMNETWNTESLTATPKRKYSHTLKGLRSGTDYEVRVLVVDKDDKYREHGANATSFRTACGSPRMPPQNVKIDSNSTSEILVKWKNPGREQWLCWSVSVILQVNGTNREFNLTQSGSTSVEEYRIPVKPYTRVHIRLRLRTPNNMYSTWTMTYNVTSAEDAPSIVPHVGLNKNGARDVLLSWGPPVDANGILRHYRVLYRPLAFRIPGCGQLDERPTEVHVPPTLTSVNLTALRPYTKYQVSVAAVTIRRGPASNVTFDTTAAVPDGPPTKLYHSRVARGIDRLEWSAVPCKLANGANQSYHLELESIDPWETELRRMTAPNSSFTYEDLVPFTRYQAKVFAQNEAGRSPWHASLNFTTAPADPREPTNLEADQPSQKSVSLSWDPPYPPYGVLNHYQLKFFKSTERGRFIEREIPPMQCGRRSDSKIKHCYTVEDLEPNKHYFFTVRAKNNGAGYSPYSVELEVETKEMAPDAPVNLTLSEATEESLKIAWEPPMRSNGILRQYKVTSQIAHTFNAMLAGSWSSTPITLPVSEKPEYYLRGLFPGSTYHVCIQASTSAGFGEAVCRNFSTKASVPVVQMTPVVEKIINNTVSIVLTPVEFVGGPITGYYLLVVREGESVDDPPKLVNFSSAQDQRLGYYVAAHLTPNQLDKGPVNFVVGGGDMTGEFENPPLTDTTPYRFALVAESNFTGDVLYGYRLTAPVIVNSSGSAASVGAIVGVIAVLLILIIVAVSATYYYLRKKEAIVYRSKNPTKRTLKERLSRLSKLDENSMSESRMTLNMESSDSVNMTAVPNGGLPSKPVPVKRLQEHAIQGQAQGILKEEYMTTPKGQLHPWDIAKKPENKSKNRYGNILPYDHSRVILAPLPEFENTDYINASYVPGYRFPRKYIATQGPKQSTLTDFWRMVWQEGSCKVVMLTNLKEQEKTKCAQYWPETSQKYGNFVVTLMKTDTEVDFVVREFQLALDNKTRTVVQFHFTTWPDHGVPLYPDALLPFLRRIWDFQPQDDHPIVVHCSGGIGRTGTLILVDSMLSQAEAEAEVNLVAHLHAMRQSRVNLVESLEQYIFAYMALVEILCSKNHKLSVKEFVSLYQKLKAKVPPTGKSAIDLEFEELGRMCPLPGPEDFRSARDAKNASKNRSSKILAGDSRRPFLSVTADGSKTDYINAVYVDGFKRRKAYLVTQMPLLETIDDFWEMLAGSGAVTLVTLGPLEDETATPSFWPDLKSTARYGKVTVEQTDTQDFRGLVVRTFKVTQSTRPARILKQFHSQSWQRRRSVPSSTDIILEILQHVERWQMQGEGRTVVVQCLDGCQECGLYCVSAAICDQLKLEQELDVFRSVRNVRASRPEFIVDSEQYAFCYDLALSFLDTFDTYSNFQ